MKTMYLFFAAFILFSCQKGDDGPKEINGKVEYRVYSPEVGEHFISSIVYMGTEGVSETLIDPFIPFSVTFSNFTEQPIIRAKNDSKNLQLVVEIYYNDELVLSDSCDFAECVADTGYYFID